jgi:hypothetical protein
MSTRIKKKEIQMFDRDDSTGILNIDRRLQESTPNMHKIEAVLASKIINTILMGIRIVVYPIKKPENRSGILGSS